MYLILLHIPCQYNILASILFVRGDNMMLTKTKERKIKEDAEMQLRSRYVSTAFLDIQMSERLITGHYRWVIGPKHGHMHVKRGEKIIFIPSGSVEKFAVRLMNQRMDGGPWEVIVQYHNNRGQMGQEVLEMDIELLSVARYRVETLNRSIRSVTSHWDP